MVSLPITKLKRKNIFRRFFENNILIELSEFIYFYIQKFKILQLN